MHANCGSISVYWRAFAVPSCFCCPGRATGLCSASQKMHFSDHGSHSAAWPHPEGMSRRERPHGSQSVNIHACKRFAFLCALSRQFVRRFRELPEDATKKRKRRKCWIWSLFSRLALFAPFCGYAAMHFFWPFSSAFFTGQKIFGEETEQSITYGMGRGRVLDSLFAGAVRLACSLLESARLAAGT